jgi:hypothetical protein
VTKGTEPVGHLLKTADGTSVITVENTPERSKSSLFGQNEGMRDGGTKAPWKGHTIAMPAGLVLEARAPPTVTGPPGMIRTEGGVESSENRQSRRGVS